MIDMIIACALFAYGMFTIQRPGFIMDFLRPVWRQFPKELHEPLFECGVCTASIWGSFAFVYILYVVTWHPAFALPIVLVAASGIGAFLDRAVKAFEKHYNYKPPSPPSKNQWSYLMPYHEMRTMLINQLVSDTFNSTRVLVEIGGHHEEWEYKGKILESYLWFDAVNPFHKPLPDNYGQEVQYDVVIFGLAFEGNLRLLRDTIAKSYRTLIEYSDDGISRQQIEFLTEGLPTQMVIPEYEINVVDAPKQCGVVSKRKIIIIYPGGLEPAF